MDQVKIGKFISALRKEKGFTQAQLAEMLGITDKAISKWETGRSMPDSGLINELCGILGISVNELFAGERIESEDMIKRSEENLITAAESLTKKEKKFRAVFSLGMGMIVLSVLVDDALRLNWLLLSVHIIIFALLRASVKEEKIFKIISVVSMIALGVSAVFTADLLINYLYSLYDTTHNTEGIRMMSIFGGLIWGDSGWSVYGYLKAFQRSMWISVLLILENIAVKCFSLIKNE